MDNFTDKSSEVIKSSFNLAEEHHNSQGMFWHLGHGQPPSHAEARLSYDHLSLENELLTDHSLPGAPHRGAMGARHGGGPRPAAADVAARGR